MALPVKRWKRGKLNIIVLSGLIGAKARRKKKKNIGIRKSKRMREKLGVISSIQ